MHPRIASAFANLSAAIAKDDVLAVDAALVELSAFETREYAPDALGLLTDQSSSTAMAVVHVCETLPHEEYAAMLMSVLPRLARRSPHWSNAIVIRVLNDERARGSLLNAARRAMVAERLALAEVCERIDVLDAAFAPKTAPFLAEKP